VSKVVIFGTRDFGRLAHFYLTNDSDHEVSAFTLNREYIQEKNFQGLPIVPFEDIEKIYPPDAFRLFVPISPQGVNRVRADRYREAKSKGYGCVTYISSKATYYDTPVGENCFIFENNVIQPFSEIGNNVIIWSGNHIGHHSRIGDHCFIASHAVISGHVTIGENSFLGVNCTIRDGVTIGARCVIGAGALVLHDTEDDSVYKGTRSARSDMKSSDIEKL
jgi:sugar O-acyltransferase (sialic acid O-acetyltransferase NeuD family)